MCPMGDSGRCVVGMANLTSKLGQIGPKWTFSGRQNVLKLILKSPRFVPFGANLPHLGPKSGYRGSGKWVFPVHSCGATGFYLSELFVWQYQRVFIVSPIKGLLSNDLKSFSIFLFLF